jgi:hypothetical protein
MIRPFFPRFPVPLPRPERAHLVADLKRRQPDSSHAEIACALRLASALLTPEMSRRRLVQVAELLLEQD